MQNPLVSCLCCTFGRPDLLGEAIKCFIDQDYDNKELIVLNDQENAELILEDCPQNIHIINYPKRFNSLGEKRNRSLELARGDYICVWDDDDLYGKNRISDSIKTMLANPSYDIVKGESALLSVNNTDYQIVRNLFHSQACITRQYVKTHQYPVKSVGEDIDFETGAKILSVNVAPFFWYVYRWGMNINHLSGTTDEKEAWRKSLSFNPYLKVRGKIVVKPQFKRNYWNDIGHSLKNINNNWGSIWNEKYNI